MKYTASRNYLLSKPESQEDFPFGPDVAVFKVLGKMFATLAISNVDVEGKLRKEARMNLKCEPGQALMLRKIFTAVEPGYHMNKKHWNTLRLDGSIPKVEIKGMIDHSYSLVTHGLKATEKGFLRTKYGSQHFDFK